MKKPFDACEITRPDKSLLKYYFLSSLLAGPFFFLPLLPLFFKYETLKYKIDSEGISMSWGILFKKEIHLTFRRIQDIHLTRNIIQRWMGLATVAVQTASGSATPEMSIEGILEADELRNFLYSKMRGSEDISANEAGDAGDSTDEALSILMEIRDILKEKKHRRES